MYPQIPMSRTFQAVKPRTTPFGSWLRTVPLTVKPCCTPWKVRPPKWPSGKQKPPPANVMPGPTLPATATLLTLARPQPPRW